MASKLKQKRIDFFFKLHKEAVRRYSLTSVHRVSGMLATFKAKAEGGGFNRHGPFTEHRGPGADLRGGQAAFLFVPGHAVHTWTSFPRGDVYPAG